LLNDTPDGYPLLLRVHPGAKRVVTKNDVARAERVRSILYGSAALRRQHIDEIAPEGSYASGLTIGLPTVEYIFFPDLNIL